MRRPDWLNTRRLGLRRNAVLCALDAPVPGQGYAAWLDVTGWALSLDGAATEVTVTLDEQRLATVTPHLERPDVALRFPRLRRGARCGFHVRVPRADLPDRPASILEVRAARAGSRGDRDERLLRLALHRHPVSAPPHARLDYRTVWDGLSQTPARARDAISGTEDAVEFERTGEVTAQDVAMEAAITRDDVVLEIGCGTGRVGRSLAPRCRAWIGTDVAPRMLEHARDTLADLPNVTLQLLSGLGLSEIATASVDVVYCSAVFMHLDEWDRYRYVKEAHRVLRPGGRLWFDNISLLTDEGWAIFERLCALDPGARPPHISKTSTPAELRAYAERAGFVHVRVREGLLFVSVFGAKPGAAHATRTAGEHPPGA